MVADMSYDTVSKVLDSWEAVRRETNYEEVVGVKLFVKLFQLEPNAKRIFGFSKSFNVSDSEALKSPRFVKHAKYFIQMIDKALGMLGPDIELLTEILLELGAKHVSYGVQPEYFPSMGRALLYGISEILSEDEYTEDVKDAWVEVYGALSYDMIRGQKTVKR